MKEELVIGIMLRARLPEAQTSVSQTYHAMVATLKQMKGKQKQSCKEGRHFRAGKAVTQHYKSKQYGEAQY